MTRTLTGWLLMLLLLACAPGFAQKESAMRSVQGLVSNPDESAAAGAVVQLKNLKTLQVRSFITLEDGTYRFFELSPDVDYELRAENKGATSPTKTLSSFDSRKAANLDLKIKK